MTVNHTGDCAITDLGAVTLSLQEVAGILVGLVAKHRLGVLPVVLDYYGVSIDGRQIGDWRVVVEQTEAPAAAGCGSFGSDGPLSVDDLGNLLIGVFDREHPASSGAEIVLEGATFGERAIGDWRVMIEHQH